MQKNRLSKLNKTFKVTLGLINITMKTSVNNNCFAKSNKITVIADANMNLYIRIIVTQLTKDK
jgi:hypothetical protein